MRKKLYIIPGWKETPKRKAYRQLEQVAHDKGYDVVFKPINWSKPLSQQYFEISENDTIFGFSLGAIFAWLLTQKQVCRHLILASMTPHYSFRRKTVKKELTRLVGEVLVKDVLLNLRPTNKTKKQTVIYGDKEDERGDILVPNTEHELNQEYIKVLKRIL